MPLHPVAENVPPPSSDFLFFAFPEGLRPALASHGLCTCKELGKYLSASRYHMFKENLCTRAKTKKEFRVLGGRFEQDKD